MISWNKKLIGDVIEFNPRIGLKKGTIIKKVPMPFIGEFQRKINDFEFAEYNSGPKFMNNDVILAKINPSLENGKAAKVDILEENEVGFGSTEFIVLRETDESDANFIYYLVVSPTFRKKAIGCMEGTSGRRRVNENTLKYFELPFPEKNEQQRIGSFLADLDAKIEVNNKINAELEVMAKLIYDYWFVQFDFPDANGKPYKSSGGKMVYNAVLKREIPEGWNIKKLDELAEIKRGKLVTAKTADLNGQYKVVSAGIDYSYMHSEYNREKHTITVSGSGANAGFINFWRERIFANDCTTVRGKTDEETFVILQFLKLRQEYILNQARGSAQPHVYPKDLESLKILIPNVDLFEKYGKTVLPFNEQIAVNEIESQNLAELRDWLLPMLMNGQVTVGEAKEKLGMVAEEGEKYGK